MLVALKNYKKKQDNFKRVYRKDYQYYHLEEVKNKYGKIPTSFEIIKNKKEYCSTTQDLI